VLFDDVYKAEDALDSNLDPHQTSSPTSPSMPATPYSQPISSRNFIKYIKLESWPANQEQRTRSLNGSPCKGAANDSQGHVPETGMGTLTGVSKAQEQSMRAAENLDWFQVEADPAKGECGGSSPRVRPRSVTLSPSKKRGKKAKGATEAEEETAANDVAAETDTNAKTDADRKSLEPTDSDLHAITADPGLAIESMLAADACTTFLASDRLWRSLSRRICSS
jgi:hypothetical protein